MFTDIEILKLKGLGRRLKKERLRRNDPQSEFAVRVGVSIPTLYKMEKGDPSVTIGYWIKALSILNKLDELDNLIVPPESLFEKYETLQKTKHRQRARKK
ncbi:MAG: helix-turn-helix domain-containing protein [Desulfobacteraceae bacterium]|nr:helix-turn-helix domain-containing protein [Desulfobacteraceae bacterium]